MRFIIFLISTIILSSHAQVNQTLVGRFDPLNLSNFQIISSHIDNEEGPLFFETVNAGLDTQVFALSIIENPGLVNIEVFHNSILQRFINAANINLQRTGMTRIGGNSFFSCSSVIFLNLRHNLISQLPGNVFRNCLNIFSIDLSHNQINTINSEAFFGLIALEAMDLRMNNFTTINAAWFPLIPLLTVLSLSDNPIRSIEANSFPPQLRNLQMRDCLINDIHANAFYNLTQLIELALDGNPITGLPAGVFNHLTALRTLGLSRTNIRRLNSNSFTQHPNLTTFIIDSSGLDEIQPGFFDHFTTLWNFDSRNNHCANVSLVNVNLIDFNEDPVLHTCFAHWFVARPTTTSTVAPPPQDSSAKGLIGSGILIMILGVLRGCVN